MRGMFDILGSEKGIMALAVLLCATVLCALRILSSQQWLDFTQWIFTVYVGGKTVQGVATGYYATKTPATQDVAPVAEPADPAAKKRPK